jgi:HEAT repeats
MPRPDGAKRFVSRVACEHDRRMGAEQLDLFTSGPIAEAIPVRAEVPPAAETLTDEALIAALPDADLGGTRALTAEAGRRRLAAAVPALEALCGRLTGFGSIRVVPEQVAAIDALVAIGGPQSARAVARLIARGAFQGPTLVAAVAAAMRLSAPLPRATVLALLRHPEPAVRAGACRCARPGPETAEVLIDLANDLNPDVAMAALCALGGMGRTEARPALKRLIREAPSAEMIDALASVADEEGVILLARVGRERPDLAAVVLSGLEGLENPRAKTAASALRLHLADTLNSEDSDGNRDVRSA